VHNIVGIGSFETEDILAKVQHRNDEWKLLIHGIPIYATKIWRMNLVIQTIRIAAFRPL
jgi:hypothetical protein